MVNRVFIFFSINYDSFLNAILIFDAIESCIQIYFQNYYKFILAEDRRDMKFLAGFSLVQTFIAILFYKINRNFDEFYHRFYFCIKPFIIFICIIIYFKDIVNTWGYKTCGMFSKNLILLFLLSIVHLLLYSELLKTKVYKFLHKNTLRKSQNSNSFDGLKDMTISF